MRLVHHLKLMILKTNGMVGLASNTQDTCKAKLEMLGHEYPDTELSVLSNLRSVIIIGYDLLQQHSAVHFGGNTIHRGKVSFACLCLYTC